MSWRHPNDLPRAAGAINHRDVTEAIRPATEEVNGKRLNEHNIAENFETSGSSTPTRAADFDLGISLKFFYEEYYEDCSDTESGSSPVRIDQSLDWIEVVSKDFSTVGGDLYLLTDVQYCAFTANQSYCSYLQLAYKLNGQVVRESIIGDLDVACEAESMETGIGGYHQGAQVEFDFNRIPPGNHTVALVARVLPLPGVSDDNDVSALLFAYQMTGELAER